MKDSEIKKNTATLVKAIALRYGEGTEGRVTITAQELKDAELFTLQSVRTDNGDLIFQVRANRG
jgi:hypothetical protein